MKNGTLKVIMVVIALLALAAAVIIVLASAPAAPEASALPSPSPAVSLSVSPVIPPSPPPSATASPVATVQPSQSPSVTPKPLSGYYIGIDPGHQQNPNPDQEANSPGSSDTKDKVSSGAYGSYTGMHEYEINLQIAFKLKASLEALGAKVIMTRETSDVDLSNIERAKMMNEAGVDCWLRIHANNSADKKVHGMFMLVPAKGCLDTDDDSVYDDSLSLADALLASALSSTGAQSRGIDKRSDQTGFNWSKIPVCTIEMGFMTNENEDKLLASDEYQQKIADGLAQGFADYFANKPASKP